MAHYPNIVCNSNNSKVIQEFDNFKDQDAEEEGTLTQDSYKEELFGSDVVKWELEIDPLELPLTESDVTSEGFITEAEIQTKNENRIYIEVPIIKSKMKCIQQNTKKECDKFYSCTLCEKKCKSQSGLKLHLTTHTDVKSLYCYYCHKIFRAKYYLQRHIISVHTTETPHSCDTCGQKFKWKEDLKEHVIKAHTKEFPYHCSICERGFLIPSELKIHMRRHAGEKPFPCSICENKYVSQRDLNKHMNTHFEERLPRCLYCEKTFTANSSLKKHNLRAHSDDKPLSCEFCDRKFKLKEELRVHTILAHTKDRPFKCTLCTKSYLYSKDLKKHMVKHPIHFSSGVSKKKNSLSALE